MDRVSPERYIRSGLFVFPGASDVILQFIQRTREPADLFGAAFLPEGVHRRVVHRAVIGQFHPVAYRRGDGPGLVGGPGKFLVDITVRVVRIRRHWSLIQVGHYQVVEVSDVRHVHVGVPVVQTARLVRQRRRLHPDIRYAVILERYKVVYITTVTGVFRERLVRRVGLDIGRLRGHHAARHADLVALVIYERVLFVFQCLEIFKPHAFILGRGSVYIAVILQSVLLIRRVVMIFPHALHVGIAAVILVFRFPLALVVQCAEGVARGIAALAG